ncbi:MAG: NAD(P)-dependent oxidoreductase [Gammaproteobacteria bacterium]|nr:NAD(P)-dependent oxidoreductase [Gammaproteobacteria bacterium]
MRIGFLGLGQMGAPIAANLRRAGHDLIVWNRSSAKLRALTDLGAATADTPRAACADREIVCTMLSDDAALRDVVHGENGLAAGLAPAAVHVSLSTIGVRTADEIAAVHAKLGRRFVSAPVFGRPEAAAAAKLFIVAAGDPADIDLVDPAFGVIGQRVFRVGATPSAANLVKLCGNFMILAAIEALGESLALAGKAGIDQATVLDVLTGSLFDAPVYRNYGAILLKERYRPAGFAAPLGLKDMRLAAESSETLRVPMPLLSLLRDRLLETIAIDGPDTDWSTIARASSRAAGLIR